MSSRKRRSPRLDIRNLDNQISRYPTISRTGDRDRLGNRPIFFDDTDTVFFTSYIDTITTGQIVSMPTTLKTGSKYLTNDLTTSIYVPGNVIKDSELWQTPTRQFEAIRPFREYKLYEQDIKDTHFYATGSSLEEFGDQFLSHLGNKTRIFLEIPVSTATQLQPRSASIYYLNSTLGRFEEIASNIRHRPHPNINFWESRLFGPLGNNIASSTQNDVLNVGSSPWVPTEAESRVRSYLKDGIIGFDTAYDNTGRLLQLAITHSALIDSAFEATSSQYIFLRDYINHPFLVEKVVMDIPIKAGPGWLRDFTRFTRFQMINGYRFDPFDAGGPCLTIGLLNQLNRNNRDLILSATLIPAADNFASASRDLDPYFERFSTGFLSYGKPSYVVHSSSDGTFTGTIRLNLEPRVSNGLTSIAYFSDPYGLYPSNNGRSFRNSFALAVNPFGRGMRGTQSGRSIFGKEYAVPDDDPAASLAANFPPATTGDVFIFNFEKNSISPYLLFPNDKLVLSISKYRACISQSAIEMNPQYDFNTPMPLNASHDIWMDTGSVRIALYGSLIKENAEYHDTLNSRLDTNAVHEMIHEKVLDEWDVSSLQEFTSSYISAFMSGSTSPFRESIFDPSTGDIFDSDNYNWTRQAQFDSTNFDPFAFFNNSSYASEQAIQRWERVQFFRNAQLRCESEQYYDSLIPRFDELFAVEKTGAPYNARVGKGDMLITLDFIDSITFGFAVIDWTKSFPFEPKYSHLIRTKYIDKVRSNINTVALDFFGVVPRPSPLAEVDRKIAIEMIPPGSSYTVWGDYENGQFTGLRYDDLIAILYGSGDMNNIRLPGTPQENLYPGNFFGSTCRPAFRKNVVVSPATLGGTPNYGYGGRTYRGVLLRGWKYGLINGYEMQTKAVFRRDRYGQFRDMLEQRADAKFFDGKSVLSSPVKVQFIGPKGSTVRPETTFSSNLSFEATSSLPYFDGVVRNREEPIYVPSIYSVRFTK